MTQGFNTHSHLRHTTTLECLRLGVLAKLLRALAVFFFSFVFYINPASLALADELTKEQKHEAALTAILEATPEQKLSHRMAKLYAMATHELPNNLQTREQKRSWFKKTLANITGEAPISKEELNELRQLKSDAEDAYKEAMASFQQEANALTNAPAHDGKKLSPAAQKLITSRHQEALAHIQKRHANLTTLIDALLTAKTGDAQRSALAALSQDLKRDQFKRTHTPVTPNKLPWGTPKADVRAPLDSPSELQAALGLNPFAHYAKLALAGDADPGLIAQAAANAANQELQAALGESVEVQITPEIKALAQSLHSSSTEIYAWVHNSIKFIPSYGSIQGAQATLETKQGNALDTASLLIALLRAAKIPARYAYGTVEIPAEQVMNWVGGAHTPEAAQQLLGQGGIPNIGLLEGGKIAKFKMEHVWVEAFVDFVPSRGMVENVGDSWVPMDGSFKQYEFTDGMNLKDTVPFDAQQLADTLKQKSVINEAEGWVQNVPQADIEQQLAEFQAKLKNHIEQQNPNATVGEVLGLQKITIIPARPLAAGLPYQRIITSQKFIEVPDKLRHKFKYSLATQTYGYAGDAFISIEEPTAKLAGKTLALSFKPASKNDEDIIAAQLPAANSDGIIDPARLPKTLPGYLINLAAEFSINGEAIKSNPAGSMGGELYEEMGLYSPSTGWETSINHPVAGEYRAIGLDLQGANIEQAARLKQRLEHTKTQLESAETTQLSALTKHDLVGDLLYGTVFNYFALNDVQDQIAAQSSNVISYRLPSYGTFSTTLNPQYWFGMPRNVEFGGLSMDIDHMKQHRVAKNNNHAETVAFSQSIGARMSAMEHLVPEQMFSTETQKTQGISAVKALVIASQQGQKIWTITSDNLELALSKINLGHDAENDIRNAVNAGKVATAHENRINFNGWIGEGYTLIDPQTGAGAYMISGGGNGGLIFLGLLLVMSAIFIMSFLVVGAPIAALGIVVLQQIVVTMGIAGGMLIAAGIAAATGEKFLCSKLVGSALAILTYALNTLLPITGGIVGAAFFGAFFSDATGVCG